MTHIRSEDDSIARRLRVGIDVGGTFTDVLVLAEDSAEIGAFKTLTTAPRQSEGVLAGIEEARGASSTLTFLAHGSTVGINTLLERSGARAALITTEGFTDVLEIRRTDRERSYDIQVPQPRPLVPRARRRGVRERIGADGEILEPLDEHNADTIIAELLADGVEAIAIALLHSYVNPVHELRLAELIRAQAPHAHLSLSCIVNPEYREFERTSTVVVDAYVKPRMSDYLETVESSLRDAAIEAELLVMQSDGGLVSAGRASATPARTLGSGPAAGAIAAARVASELGSGDVVSFDVGGTSTDVSLIRQGAPLLRQEADIEFGMPVRAPMIDVQSIGSGGGSIAWIDRGGVLRVGPASAGSDPGPIAYGNGGTRPTLSDAFVVKGVLGTELAGGRVALDYDAARIGLVTLAAELDLPLERVVDGIITIAEASMAKAVRAVSLWKGVDPKDVTLMGYGGAGGLVAANVAIALGIPRVVVPPYPGNMSALGLLMTDLVETGSQTYLALEEDASSAEITERFGQIRETCAGHLAEQRVDRSQIVYEHYVAVRYEGQIHELPVVVPFPLDTAGLQGAFASFAAEYEDIYGIRLERLGREITALRVVGGFPLPRYRPVEWHAGETQPRGSTRPVIVDGSSVESDVYERYELAAGVTLRGPTILEELGSTIWVPPACEVEVDRLGNCIIHTDQEEVARAGD